MDVGILGQIQTRWQTSQPRPRRPRTNHKPNPCFPGTLGPKAARDGKPRRSGVPEPPFLSLHPAAHNPGSERRLAPRAHPAAALPTPALRLLLWLRGRQSRDRRFPRPPPPRRFRFRRRSGTSGVLSSGSEPAPHVHVGCVTRR